MIVKKLYILSTSNVSIYSRVSSDIEPSGNALRYRNANKQGQGDVVFMHLERKHLPVSTYYKEPLGVDFKEQLKAIQESDEKSVGVYIVAHGTEDDGFKVGGHTSPQLAELVFTMGFKAIKKLCIVSCGMKYPYLKDFAKALAALSNNALTPMIAGYQGFISVVGSAAAKQQGSVYDVGQAERIKLDWDSPDHRGKKIIKADQLGLSTPSFFQGTSHILLRSSNTPGCENDERGKNRKLVVQFDGTAAVTKTVQEWHEA